MKKKKFKWWHVLVVIILLGALVNACGQSDSDSPSSATSASNASIIPSSSVSSEPDAESSAQAAEADATAKVDSIARQAKDDAKKASEKDLNNAYVYIRDHYKTCFDSNETMEQMMYNGWLLEYAYEGDSDHRDYYNLGQDAEQLVKYVYRGAESPEDQSTKENLSQVETSIGKIKAAAAEEEKSKQSEATTSSDSEKKTATSTNAEKKSTTSTDTNTEKKTTTSTDTNTEQETTAPAETQNDGEARVWIPTNGGTKYHSYSSCSNMKNPQEVTISEAKSRGFTPCGRCY